jgi:hypothetical protein
MFSYRLSKNTLETINKIAYSDARLAAFNNIIQGMYENDISPPILGDDVAFASMDRNFKGFSLEDDRYRGIVLSIKDFTAVIFYYSEEEDALDVKFMKKEFSEDSPDEITDRIQAFENVAVVVYRLRFKNYLNSSWVVCDIPGSPLLHNDNVFKLLFDKKNY